MDSQAPSLDLCSLLNQVSVLTTSYLIKTVLEFGFPLGLNLEFERIKMLRLHPKDSNIIDLRCDPYTKILKLPQIILTQKVWGPLHLTN